jgi:hypothetical protein
MPLQLNSSLNNIFRYPEISGFDLYDSIKHRQNIHNRG